MEGEGITMAIYKNEKEIKVRMRKAGLCIRDLASNLKIPPGTLSNQLGGWAPLAPKTKEKILQIIKRTTKRMGVNNHD